LHVAEPELLAMPSRAVDLLWHEFILHTVDYKEFCLQAYGHDLHHSPERSMDDQQTQVLNGEGMARTFAMACADDRIQDPTQVLPTLFTVDAILGLDDGQLWRFDCGTTDCSAAAPWRCVRHRVLPFAPRGLPRQRDPRTGRWLTQDPNNHWLYVPAGEFHDGHHSGAGHPHGGQPDTGHSGGGSSHGGHAHSGASCGGGQGVSLGADGAGQYSDSGGSSAGSDSGGSGGGSDSGGSGGGSDGGGSSCGGSSCGGSSCGGSS
jgi:hypothetical protein